MRLGPYALACVSLACARAPTPAQEFPPEVTLQGVQMRYFQGDTLSAAGRAARLTYQRVTTDFVASEALMRFPSRPGTSIRSSGAALSGVEVRAPTVKGNLGTRQADGFGGVVLRSSQGMVGRSDRAHFDGQSELAYSQTPARIDGPGYHLDGRNFSFDFRQDRFEFGGGVNSKLGGAP